MVLPAPLPPARTQSCRPNFRGRYAGRYARCATNRPSTNDPLPLDFLARLAALVPEPRVNLIRFHGVFAPNGSYRFGKIREVVDE